MIEHLSDSGGCFDINTGERFCYDSPEKRMRIMVRADGAEKRMLLIRMKQQGG